jgi:hypothetical protein
MLKLTIIKIKNIDHLVLSLPIRQGLFALTGDNGTGKSSIMSILSNIVIKPTARNNSSRTLKRFHKNDFGEESLIRLEYEGVMDVFIPSPDMRTMHINRDRESDIKGIGIPGFFEASVIYGTRFKDTNLDAAYRSLDIDIDTLEENIQRGDKNIKILDAYSFVTENLGYILQGNKEYYKELKRAQITDIGKKEPKKSKNKLFNGTPYFLKIESGALVSQFRMSAGECMMISLLHTLNRLIRNVDSQQKDGNPKVQLILIDEVELALHPSAIRRLVDTLRELSEKHHLCIYFATHSREIIHQISPSNIFHLQRIGKNIDVINPCTSNYAIRDIYTHDGYDYLILVEDELSKIIIERIIDENDWISSRLIKVLAIGGWRNVLKFHVDINQSHLLGNRSCRVLSVLDGDIKDQCEKMKKEAREYTSIPIHFLPIKSLEKYLREKLVTQPDKDFFKEVNDRFFTVKSLKEVIEGCNKKEEDKALYACLTQELTERGVDIKTFVTRLADIIYQREEFEPLKDFLRRAFNK